MLPTSTKEPLIRPKDFFGISISALLPVLLSSNICIPPVILPLSSLAKAIRAGKLLPTPLSYTPAVLISLPKSQVIFRSSLK